MRALGILLVAVLALGGCGINTQLVIDSRDAPKLQAPPEGKHVRVDEELRRKWDKKTVEIIRKKRQIVYRGGYQIMAYCGPDTVKKASDPDSKEKGAMCMPPKGKDRDAVMGAAVYVMAGRLNTKPGTPIMWKVRLENRSESHICVHASWKFIDMQADDYSYGWHYLSPYTALERGYIKQKTWSFFRDEELVFDFWGHVQSLYIRGATEDGECIGDLQSED